jgi:CTP synthase (UTP-ammonia lyase)
MISPLRIGIIGDYNVKYPSHAATHDALGHAAQAITRGCVCQWLPTESLESAGSEADLAQHDALWCAPGSPYASMEGALRAIRYAREHDRPFLGT